ncbi:hypothetical protein TNCV_5034701 [Trichonephila clavipes]|nr:hypothetical protein TNCV_5034701 [Trichonephila clavipes]
MSFRLTIENRPDHGSILSFCSLDPFCCFPNANYNPTACLVDSYSDSDFPNNQEALLSKPDDYLTIIDSGMNKIEGSRPLYWGAVFESLIAILGPLRLERPLRLEVLNPPDDALITSDLPLASTPAFSGISATIFDLSRRHTPTQSTVDVPSLLSLCIRFINRGLVLSQKISPISSPIAHQEVISSLTAQIVSTSVSHTLGHPSYIEPTPLLVLKPSFLDAQVTSVPSVLHPLASGIYGKTVTTDASINCHYCDHVFRTQRFKLSHSSCLSIWSGSSWSHIFFPSCFYYSPSSHFISPV